MSENYKNNSNSKSWDTKNLFTGTAWYYSHYRPGYPNALFQMLIKKFSLDPGSRILDLGCGTGQIALKLAPYVSEVVAIDPQSEMLKEGRICACSEGIFNIKWLVGESGDLNRIRDTIGEINLAIIARAFHWMDREKTLCDLHSIISLNGGVALVNDSSPLNTPRQPWQDIIDQTVKYWLGKERKAGTTGTFKHPVKSYESLLNESRFQDLEINTITDERNWSTDQIIGYLYSTSYSSLPVLGEKKELFEEDLRSRLSGLDPSDKFKETVIIQVMTVQKQMY